MKNIIRISAAVLILLHCMITVVGCGSETSVLTASESTEDTVVADDVKKKEVDGKQDSNGEQNLKADVVSEDEAVSKYIFVDVCGAVNVPGVYQMAEGSRIFHAIEMAGGFAGDAARDIVNQAEVLSDGQQIRIYTNQEAEELKLGEGQSLMAGSSGTGADAGQSQENALVDINQADKDTLMTLTGVGASRAEAILAYRQQHGGFSSIEELMQVDGIKEKIYEKLKDKITVTNQ